jgi:MoaA/NifB/PqqE/SkfB family radical SAM enzyme
MLVDQTFALMNRCNLACTYCWYELGSNSYPDRVVEIDGYADWMARCAAHGRLRTAYLTGGEPLMREDIIALVELFGARFEHVVLMTNGLLLTDEIADAIGRVSGEIHVSLDHVSRSIPDQVRGGTRAAITALENLRRWKVGPVQVTAVLTARNHGDTAEILAFCRAAEFHVELVPVSVPAQHPLSLASVSDADRAAITRLIDDHRDLLGRPAYYARVKSYLDTGAVAKMRSCRAATNGVFVESDGEIYVCGQRRKPSLGNIGAVDVADLLANQRAAIAARPVGPCVSLDCLALS